MNKTETQYDVIKRLHRTKEWVCANDYRNHYIPYFWKRQAEMANTLWERRPCEHGTKRGLDYKMIGVQPVLLERVPQEKTLELRQLQAKIL